MYLVLLFSALNYLQQGGEPPIFYYYYYYYILLVTVFPLWAVLLLHCFMTFCVTYATTFPLCRPDYWVIRIMLLSHIVRRDYCIPLSLSLLFCMDVTNTECEVSCVCSALFLTAPFSNDRWYVRHTKTINWFDVRGSVQLGNIYV
jgi:hypothetical protein